ncbi:hypothetical protein ACWF94_02455 [Streptomyces sp. NPDC055078]
MSDDKKGFERPGPDGPPDDRTENEMVNNGLGGSEPDADGPSASERSAGEPGTGGPGAGGPGAGWPGGSGLGTGGPLGGEPEGEELALRRLLQGAVQDLAPAEGALDQLRRAVPARRARKRQALIGAAAAALLIGTAVPAFVTVADSGGGGDEARPVNAGHGQHTQGGSGGDKKETGGEHSTGGPTAGVSGKPQYPDTVTRSPGSPQPGTGSGDGATGAPQEITGSVAASSPVCDAAQLGIAASQAAGPDAEGKVYGSFRVANVSTTACAIDGKGTVSFEPQGAADRAKINVVDHTSGDAATGLPDPAQESSALLLKPDKAYEVRFAWVPNETCPTTGPSPDPSPSEGGGGSTTTGASSSGTGTPPGNTSPQLITEDGGTQDGSIAITHTADPGAPSAETTIPNACSGTIYRTGVLTGQ